MLAVLKAALSMFAALGNALGLYLQQKQAKEAKEERKEEMHEAQSTSNSIAADPASAWLREFNPNSQAGVAHSLREDGASTEADKAST